MIRSRTVALPFPFTLYDQSFTSINLSSNGNAQFVTIDTTFSNQCLPWLTHNYTIYPYWDDLYLVNSGFGIFTSISGTAPNRIFNIEWRAQYFPGSGSAGFELRLYEGQTRFDVIYGTVDNGNTIGHSRSAEERHRLYAVLLQRHRRCGYRRTKLHAAEAVANADADAYSDGHNDGNTVSDAYLPTRRFARSVDTGSAGSDRSLRRFHGQRWHLCL